MIPTHTLSQPNRHAFYDYSHKLSLETFDWALLSQFIPSWLQNPISSFLHLHLMLRSLYRLHLLLLRRPFYNMTQITNRELNRKINRRERQRKKPTIRRHMPQIQMPQPQSRTSPQSPPPRSSFARVAASREKTATSAHSTTARQMLVRRQQERRGGWWFFCGE